MGRNWRRSLRNWRNDCYAGKKNFYSKAENYNVQSLLASSDSFWLITCYVGLKAENYLLNCRVETISSPSKQASRIFETSREYLNARIIITHPYGSIAC